MRRTWLRRDVWDRKPSGSRARPTAPSPNRIRGISVDCVPFQLSQDGTHDHQWKPDWMITGVAAEAMPASTAAAGRRMPNSTTVASHSRPSMAGVVELETLVWNET